MAPRLNVVSTGSGPSLVLVHGFTQTLASWETIAKGIQATHTVARVDLPGHGGSTEQPVDFAAAAASIGATGGIASYVGYSLGGRLCLQLALDRPDLVTSLVLLGASPGIAIAADRRARREADEALACDLERDGVDSFLTRWLAQPLFATLDLGAAGLEARRGNSVDGLASVLRRLGTAEMEPLWDRLGELSMPVLIVAGEADERYSAIGAEMAERIGPSAELSLITGAGHAAHLERPEAFLAELERFFDRHQPSSTA